MHLEPPYVRCYPKQNSPSRLRRGAAAADEFVESISRLIAIEKRQLPLLENFEPFLPRKRFRRFLAAESRKIDPQRAALAATRALHHRRFSVARFGPLADFVRVGRCLRRPRGAA